MLKIILAFLQKVAAIVNNFIKKIETKLKTMETAVKSEVSGLQKMATLTSFTVDGEGNFTLAVNYSYKDADGNELKYTDAAKQSATFTGQIPDESIDPANYTSDQARAASIANNLLTALAPVVKPLIPDAV